MAQTLKSKWLVGLLAIIVSGCSSEPCDPTVPIDPALSSFYDKLYDLERGEGAQVLRVLHLGDSHIAGDSFSGALYRRFSNRFGDAGRGQLPPAKPFPYYRRQGLTVETSRGWTLFSSLSGANVGPFGLSGFRAEGASADEWMALTLDGGVPLRHVTLNILEQPGGGTLRVELDGKPAGSFSTDGAIPDLMTISLDGGAASRFVVRANGDGPVALLGWGGEGAGPGIVYEAHGIPGATLRVMDAWDADFVSAELAQKKPDLILLGYGTNEGFDDALDIDLYRQKLERRVQELKAQLPTATILLMGAFDGARLPQWARAGADASTQDAPRSALPCEPLALNERATYGDLSATRDLVLGRWHAPPKLEEVQATQRDVARAQGLAYWDGAAAMGGTCAIHTYVFSTPPLAYGDHVHLTPAGSEHLAGKFWDRLIRPYESLVCRRQLAG